MTFIRSICLVLILIPPIIPDDPSKSSLLSAADGVRLVYSDGRLHETALVVARKEWTEAPSVPSALVSMLLRLPSFKFVIVTLGENGCVMLQRSVAGLYTSLCSLICLHIDTNFVFFKW
ncbi:uncharacterized protein LOC130785218 [Actinidia eriantha]|uniref:uncharacterized protein LOC130785218 n=1 Tax=Actinidia eriantha TaxID=165200 RepID=UPI00258E6699|nr:uncharacterized protein LOC130785218 [Actinidia eriantha]